MGIYYATILIVLVFCGLAQRNDIQYGGRLTEGRVRHTRAAGFFFFLVVFWLIIIAGHRYYIGTDFGAYYKGYTGYASRFWNSLKNFNEPGFGLVSLIAMHIHDDGTTVMICTAVVMVGLSMKTIKNNTDCLTTAVLLFLFLECWHEGFNAVRQCLAVAVVFAGYGYLKNGKFFKYAICVFLGFLFHKSAIVLIVIYFFARRKVSTKNVIILLICTLAVFYSYDVLFSIHSNVLNDGIVQYSYVTSAVNILRVGANVAPAVFFLITKPKESTPSSDFYLNLLLMHAAVSLASSNSTYLARMMMYTAPFACIAIPELLKTLSERTRKWAKPLILILFCAFWLYDLSISPALNPFRFIWDVV